MRHVFVLAKRCQFIARLTTHEKRAQAFKTRGLLLRTLVSYVDEPDFANSHTDVVNWLVEFAEMARAELRMHKPKPKPVPAPIAGTLQETNVERDLRLIRERAAAADRLFRRPPFSGGGRFNPPNGAF